MNKNAYDYEAPRVKNSGKTIETNDRNVDVRFRLNEPCIMLLDNFLSEDECDELIERSKNKLTQSCIVDPITGKNELISSRTSSGTYFLLNENDFIKKIDQRIAEVMNWPIINGEGMQIINYQVGGEYKEHFDFFPEDVPGSKKHLEVGGQRVSTLIMYLNNVDDGGETFFPKLKLAVHPKKGSAVYFEYCNSKDETDPSSLHAGLPVISGEKWIATKWMRKNPYS